MPSYIKPVIVEERRQLRLKISKNKAYSDNECLSFQKLRESRNDPLSLKCEIEPKSKAFKSNFFFRTVQEWNCLPSEVKEAASKPIFREKLLEHIKHDVFKTLALENNDSLD